MGVFTQWFMTFIVVKFGPQGIQSMGWKFYIIFCVTNVLAAVFVFFCVPETKGLSLEEVCTPSKTPCTLLTCQNQIDVLFAKKDYKPILEARIRENAQRDERERSDSGDTLGNSDEKVAPMEHKEDNSTPV